jgi:hypothetical protein
MKTLIVVLLLTAATYAQTVQYPSHDDAQNAMIRYQQHQVDDVPTMLGNLLGYIQSIEVANLQLTDKVAQLEQRLAQADAFTKAKPCFPMDLKVEADGAGNRSFTYSTIGTKCTGWNKWGTQTGLQANKISAPISSGNIGSYSPTQAISFKFSIPSSVPAKFWIQAWTFDDNGNQEFSILEVK